jgi:hypothetical protein
MAQTRRKAPRRSKSRKGSGFKPLIWFLLVILILGGMALMVSYYLASDKQQGKPSISELWFSNTKNDKEKTEDKVLIDQNVQKEEKKSEATRAIESKANPLQGQTWVSMLNGTMLSIEGNRYTIDFPSVEEQLPMKGSIALSPGEFTLLNKNSDDICNNSPGVYTYSFEGDELIISVKSDSCNKRSRNMEASWFRL